MTKPLTPREYAKILARVWVDDEFRERLVANPVQALRAEGIDVPEHMKVVEADKTDNCYLLLLPKPSWADEDLAELALKQEDLSQAASKQIGELFPKPIPTFPSIPCT